MSTNLDAPWLALFVAAAMLTVSMPAMASHNSVGAPHTHVLDPSEFDGENGLLTPDIPKADHPAAGDQVSVPDDTSPYHLQFHENLEDSGLPAREAPLDQSGDRYTDCNPASDYQDEEGNIENEEAYARDLRNGEACYIGYMDQKLEYQYPTAPLIVTETPSDLLYPANPAPGDDYCRGEEETNDVTGNDDVDTAVTNVQRTQDEECNGNGHNQFLTGDLRLDVSLVETGQSTASEAAGNDAGSGTFSTGYVGSTYTFIFGQPHPDVSPVPKDDPNVGENERFEAGSGPFGPNPLELGNPLHDLSNACGDRTEECKLLEPDDIIQYDPWTWSNEFDDVSPPEQPRVCAFLPQYTFSVAGDPGDINRDQGVCGNWGEQLDEFITSTAEGGFGAPGGPPTWLTNLPGWGWGVIFTPEKSTTQQVGPYASEYFDDAPEYHPQSSQTAGFLDLTKETDGIDKGFMLYYAVNPIVPTIEGDLRCVTPNIVAEGDDSVLSGNGFTGFEDPGVYGSYRADAIDVDIHPPPFRGQFATVHEETRDEVRTVVGPAEELAEPVRDADPSDAVDDVGDALPDEAAEAVDRAQPTESGDAPAHAQAGSQNQKNFDASISQGLSCNVAGDLVFNDQETDLAAGLQFEASVNEQTTTLKDPTVLDEEGLPAPESDTNEAHWQPDLYSFGGNAHAIVDFNQNDRFDSCPGANLDPGDDLCPWESLWDAYSGQCTNRDGKPCGEVLKQNGYNVDGTNGPADQAGVGLYFVLELTGPVALTAETIETDAERVEEKTRVLGGLGDEVCIVGVSEGFQDFLPNHIGGAASAEELPSELCDDPAEATLVTDAFDAQSGVNRGGFSADVEWAKLSPTPAATDNGVEESLCVSGVWSVGDEVVGPDGNTTQIDSALDATGENNIRLEAGQVHEFSHWQSLETGTDTDPDRDTC